jgi:hypothetical protein
MNNRFKSLLILLTAIQINFACKKQDECTMKRIEIISSRGYVLIDGKQVNSPALFYWHIGAKHEISSLGSWTGDLVRISVYKELELDVKHEKSGQVVFTYEVQP